MAAGQLLVQEAGGICTDMKGQRHALTSPHILTDNGLIHDEIVGLFGEIFAGKYRCAMPSIRPEAAAE